MTAQGLQRNEVTEATQRQQQSNLYTNSIVCQHSLLEGALNPDELRRGKYTCLQISTRTAIFDRGALLFVYWKADGLAGIFILVVFYHTPLNDGGTGMSPDPCRAGEIPRETTQLPR